MKLGDSINTYDPTIELKGEFGTFRVTSPNGKSLYVRCGADSPPTIVQWGEPRNPEIFTVTKVGEKANVTNLAGTHLIDRGEATG
jgi:hypothetical protein